MDRSRLSKGAIYHYVRSKDELFGHILKEQVEATHHRFLAATQSEDGLEAPLAAIAGIMGDNDESEIFDAIFFYLLGRKEDPQVKELLRNIYQFNEAIGADWIRSGQKAGLIPTSLDPVKTAARFIAFSYGSWILAKIAPDSSRSSQEDLHQLMFETLTKN